MLALLTNNLIVELNRWRAVPWLFASVAVLAAAVFLWRRFGGAPLVLLIVGAAAFVLEYAIDVLLTFLMEYIVAPNPSTALARAVWPTCVENPAFDEAKHISHVVACICFPIGFVWYALRTARTPNRAMQRTPTRRSPEVSHD
jgi:hypothetical protein